MSGPTNGNSTESSSSLSATYTSSGNEPFTIISPLTTSSPTLTTKSRTAYLHSLRAAALSVQDQVNKELTARMEQDNKSQQPNDSKDEENYGEEAQDEE
ncbi:hypothetical protein OQA88_11318 [Cercophora sp. LCS_1]